MNSAKDFKMPKAHTNNLPNLLFEENLRFLSTGPLWNVVTDPIPDGQPLPPLQNVLTSFHPVYF
jgi:hypothetical protein